MKTVIKLVILLVGLWGIIALFAIPKLRELFDSHLGTAPPPVLLPLGRKRSLTAYLVILFVIGGFSIDIFLMREHWPFSWYPMFAGVQESTITQRRVYGLVDGEEVYLQPKTYFSPISNRVNKIMQNACTKEEHLRSVCESLLTIANERSDTQIDGLRLYEVEWELMSGATNRDAPNRRRLLCECSK